MKNASQVAVGETVIVLTPLLFPRPSTACPPPFLDLPPPVHRLPSTLDLPQAAALDGLAVGGDFLAANAGINASGLIDGASPGTQTQDTSLVILHELVC